MFKKVNGVTSWLAFLLILAVPAGVFGVVYSKTSAKFEVASESTDLQLTTISAQSGGDGRSVSVNIKWNAPLVLKSPHGEGIVTQVYAKSGDRLNTGDKVLGVNNVDKMAFFTKYPLYRFLGPADQGDDVKTLNAGLAAMGYRTNSESQKWTTQTSYAVSDLAKKLRVPEPYTGFDPQWVVWMPTESVNVASISVGVGSPAPGDGADLITAKADVTFAQVATLPVPGQAGTITVGDKPYDVGPDGIVSPEGRAAIAQVSNPDATTFDASYAPKDSGASWRVPFGTVATDSHGATCVLLLKNQSAGRGASDNDAPADVTAYQAVPVNVVTGSPASINITSQQDLAGKTVLANPGAAKFPVSCSQS